MKSKFLAYAFIALFSQANVLAAAPHAGNEPREIVIDTVLASVNGKPITLKDVAQNLRPPKDSLDIKALTSDLQARRVLDQLIFRMMLDAEAEARRLRVSDEEVNEYVAEVLRRNNLSPSDFEAALLAEGENLASYREKIRSEILRARLTSQISQSVEAVSAQEIEEYLEQHPELSKGGTKVKLRQIYISTSARSSEEASSRLSEVKKRLSEGEDFARLAAELSDGAERAEGGLLGVVAEQDLSPELFETVQGIREGAVGEEVKLDDGYRIFRVEKRYVEESQRDDKLIEEIKGTIQRSKTQAKIQAFFESELPKLHAVDKKI